MPFMKKIILAVFALGAFSFSFAQSTHSEHDGHNHGNTTAPAATVTDPLKMERTEHDFSKIPQGKPVYTEFVLLNTGSTPLKLDNVHASCGCTTPEWSRDPIAPGASTRIKVGYNAAAEGAFEKYITVTYNGTQAKQLKIRGTVWRAPEGSAPVNASLNFLKKQTF